MSKREELEAAIEVAKNVLSEAQADLANFVDAPEQNVFATLEEAAGTVEDKLLDRARDDCEGSYNCGMEKYEQEFIVDGQHYLGTLTCEYNRHDKTYYYVDGHKFSYVAI